MRSLAIAAAAVCLALAAPAHASTTVTDSAHGFTIHVPDGFEDFPDGHASPTYLYAWKRGDGDGASFQMLVVANLGGEIADGPVDLDDFRSGMVSGMHLESVTQHQLTWNGAQIPVLAGAMSDSGVTLGFVGAEVPLPDNAVMVMVVGTDSAASLDATVQQVMSTFDGDNGWTSDRDRRIGWVVGGVSVVLGAVILFAKLESRRRRA